MWVHNLNPTILHLGPLEIRWYGVMYVITFLFVYWYVRKAVKQGKLKISLEDLDNLMIYLTIALVLGARLFEVLFYDFKDYIANPIEIIKIWKGGLSFHGGLFTMLVVAYLWCRKKKIDFFQLGDIFIVPLALGQALGRLGNFINGELYGGITSLPWGIKFPDAQGYRHPTQVYEMIYDLLIFGILWKLKDKNYRNGIIFGWFMIIYSIFRTLTEFLREQEPQWIVGPFTMAQLLNIPMFLFGIWLLRRKYSDKLKNI